MKHTSVFQSAFRRLALLYAVLAVVVTLFFTIPPIVAQQQVRERISPAGHTPQFAEQIIGPGATVLVPFDDGSTIEGRIESFVNERDAQYKRHLTTYILEINGLMLLLTIVASYFLARHSLQPLQQVLDQQETFAAELAHELKTPLATALMELEEIKRSGKNLTKEQQNSLAQVLRDIKEVGNLTEQTLALMAVEYTETMQNTEALLIASVIKRASLTVETAAKNKGVKLEIEKIPEIKIVGSEVQLRQLFVILLDNAVKYTPKGGQVTVSAHEESGSVAIQVKDTGVGIPRELHEKVFTKFFQGEHDAGGSGLGLAIARRICDVHGGSITLSSTEKVGSIFTVHLPAVS